MSPDVPLVVPEVNADDMKHHKGVIASPTARPFNGGRPESAAQSKPIKRVV